MTIQAIPTIICIIIGLLAAKPTYKLWREAEND